MGGGLLRQKQINKTLIKLKMGFNKINDRLKRINNANNFTRQQNGHAVYTDEVLTVTNRW